MATPKQLVQALQAGNYDTLLATLYCGVEHVETQRMRYIQAVQAFADLFGQCEGTAIYSAPGRTEIGGNHTDHQHGKVLAAAVNLDIIAVAAPSGEPQIYVASKGFRPDTVGLDNLQPSKAEHGKSSALVRGVAAAIVQRGGKLGGVNVYTTNNVLGGSGLSSSAAFEVCIAAILNDMFNGNRFTAVELGQIGQYAENEFFGKPSGLLDQTTCAVGSAITIDFADTANPIVEKIPFHLEQLGYKLIITDTKGSHAGLTDEYAAVRAEMQQVAAFFGKTVLRDITEKQLLANLAAVRKQTGDRPILRALHFFGECRRVEAATKAIRNADMPAFLPIIVENGNSSFEYNQNAYSVTSVKEQGIPLGLALSQLVLQGRGAWRLQGGGFAGTIQAFVPNALCEAYVSSLENVFGKGACYLLSIREEGAIKVCS